MSIRLSTEVAAALAAHQRVVALKSTTITSRLGLPSPHNHACLERVVEAIRAACAVPAVTAVIEGELWAGIEPHHEALVLGAERKLAERDLPVAEAEIPAAEIVDAIAAATEGRSVPANLALAESNARLAGEIAVALLRS